MIQAIDMNPHMQLELVKMTIRPKAIEISMRLRKRRTTSSKISMTK